MHKDEKKSKFNFETMKADATSDDPKVRKNIFIEYFERFQEFPSYLFDSESGVDSRLQETIQDLRDDPETSKTMQKGIETLMRRLPSV